MPIRSRKENYKNLFNKELYKISELCFDNESCRQESQIATIDLRSWLHYATIDACGIEKNTERVNLNKPFRFDIVCFEFAKQGALIYSQIFRCS